MEVLKADCGLCVSCPNDGFARDAILDGVKSLFRRKKEVVLATIIDMEMVAKP